MSKEGSSPETKHQSKLTEKMRTPRTNRALKGANAGLTFQTVHNAIIQQKLDEKQYNFYLDIQLPDKTQPLKINLSVATDYNVSEALIKALQKFNLQLQPFGIELDLEIKNYAPRLPKKSGKPKLDMPCLDLAQKISDVKVQALSIQIKNKQAIKRINKGKNSQVTTSTEKKQKRQEKQLKQTNQKKQQIQVKPKKQKKQKVEPQQIKLIKQQIKIEQTVNKQIQMVQKKTIKPEQIKVQNKIQQDLNTSGIQKKTEVIQQSPAKKNWCFSSIC